MSPTNDTYNISCSYKNTSCLDDEEQLVQLDFNVTDGAVVPALPQVILTDAH